MLSYIASHGSFASFIAVLAICCLYLVCRFFAAFLDLFSGFDDQDANSFKITSFFILWSGAGMFLSYRYDKDWVFGKELVISGVLATVIYLLCLMMIRDYSKRKLARKLSSVDSIAK